MRNVVEKEHSVLRIFHKNGVLIGKAEFKIESDFGKFDSVIENCHDIKLNGSLTMHVQMFEITEKRKGYGRYLINKLASKLISHCDSKTKNLYLFVNVLRTNIEAIEFYKAVGFKPTQFNRSNYSLNMIREVIR